MRNESFFERVWQQISVKRIALTLLFFSTIELISFFTFQNAVWSGIATFGIAIAVLLLSIYDLRIGIGIQIMELIISSKGYLFTLTISDTALSVRIVLFVAVWLAAVYHIGIQFRKGGVFTLLKREQVHLRRFGIALLLIMLAVLHGIANTHSLAALYADTNSYLFLGWIVPVLVAIRTREDAVKLFAVVLASVVWLYAKTILFLLLFSHPGLFGETMGTIYLWVRRTGVGEITPFPDGFSRIFFQSHIYAIVILSMSLWNELLSDLRSRSGVRIFNLLLGFTSVAVILLSYSRSFWLGAIAVVVTAGIFWVAESRSVKTFVCKSARYLVTIAAFYYIGKMILLGVVAMPIPGGQASTDNLLSQRATTSDPAAASRWNQLRPLQSAIAQQPFFGQGLGKTVTYISNDPRVRQQSPTGEYTTFAFEWGYLDQILKFGFVGMFILAMLFISPVANWWRNRGMDNGLVTGLLLGLFGIAVIHTFTPYWNHPLGIGWYIITYVVLSQIARQKEERV